MEGGSGGEGQVLSFLVYSLLVYPATSYLLSPQRQLNKTHGRRAGVLLATVFLSLVAASQLFIDMRQQGPNLYQSLGATRNTSPVELKRLYKKRMLETHPDKNRSPQAVEEFRRAKLANDVLSSGELRSIYDRLGEQGLRVFAGEGGAALDLSHVITQIFLGSASSILLAFFMTITEPTGDAFAHSMFGLGVIVLLEMIFVVGGRPLPAYLFPSWSTHDLVSALHSLFPAGMHACRCICSSLHEDPFLYRVEVLDRLVEGTQGMTAVTKLSVKAAYTCHDRFTALRRKYLKEISNEDRLLIDNNSDFNVEESICGPLQRVLRAVRDKTRNSNLDGERSVAAHVLSIAEQVASMDRLHPSGEVDVKALDSVKYTGSSGEGLLDFCFSYKYFLLYLFVYCAYTYY